MTSHLFIQQLEELNKRTDGFSALYELRALLVTNRQAIIDLVKAAEEVARRDHEGIEIIRHDIYGLKSALASFKVNP